MKLSVNQKHILASRLDTASRLFFAVIVKTIPLLFYVICSYKFEVSRYGALRELLFDAELVGLLSILGINQILYSKGLQGKELEKTLVCGFSVTIPIALVCWMIVSLLRGGFSVEVLVYANSFVSYLMAATYLGIRANKKAMAILIIVESVLLGLVCFETDFSHILTLRILINYVFFAIALWNVIVLRKLVFGDVKRGDFVGVLKEGMNLFLFPLIALLSLKLDGLLFIHFFDSEAWGIYSNAILELPIISLSLMYIGSVHANELASEIKRRDTVAAQRRLVLMLRSSTVLILPFGVWAFILAPEILDLAFGHGYSQGKGYFRLYLLLIPGKLLTYSWVLIPMQKYRFMLVRAVMDLLANLSLGLLLLPVLSTYAFGTSTVVSFYIVSVIGNILFIKRELSINIPALFPWKKALCWCLVAGAVVFVPSFAIQGIQLILGSLLLVSLFVLTQYKLWLVKS